MDETGAVMHNRLNPSIDAVVATVCSRVLPCGVSLVHQDGHSIPVDSFLAKGLCQIHAQDLYFQVTGLYLRLWNKMRHILYSSVTF